MGLSKQRLASAIAGIVLGQVTIAPALAQTAVNFTQLSSPVGVAADTNGNTFASGCANATCFQSSVFKLAPNAAVLFNTVTGGITSTPGYLTRDPASGRILSLSPDGVILAIDPNTGAQAIFLSLRNLRIDTSAIFDIATARASNFGGLIQPQFSTYGDLAIVQRNNSTYLFVSGLSSAFPFVLRLRIQGNTLAEARVLVASRASTVGSVNLTRGVAVNPQGTVLTTLPTARSAFGTFDVPVRFGVDYNPVNGRGGVPQILFNRTIDLASQGMTTDSFGNFYVATNSIGSAALGVAGAGALVVFPPTLDRVLAQTALGQNASNLRDVTINPRNGLAYATLQPFCVGPCLGQIVISRLLAPPTIRTLRPTRVGAGATVVIRGTNFINGATIVRFNTVNAVTVTYVSPTEIRAIVPRGATTGRVTVITAGGSAPSSTNLTIAR